MATQLGIEFAGLADLEPAERRCMLEEVLRLYPVTNTATTPSKVA